MNISSSPNNTINGFVNHVLASMIDVKITGDGSSYLFKGSNRYEVYLSDKLEKEIDEDSKRPAYSLNYLYSFKQATILIDDLEPEIDRIATEEGINKELITAVLFREIMFLNFSDLFDGYIGKTIGLAQIGVQNVRNNELLVHPYDRKFEDKSDEEIIEKLKENKESVYFAAVQLKARAIREGVSIDTDDPEEIKKIFEGYNDSPKKKDMEICAWYTKKTYGEQTYDYYEIFKRY